MLSSAGEPTLRLQLSRGRQQTHTPEAESAGLSTPPPASRSGPAGWGYGDPALTGLGGLSPCSRPHLLTRYHPAQAGTTVPSGNRRLAQGLGPSMGWTLTG